MARYDVSPAEFRTPNGNPVSVYVREGTNDWNTAQSALNEDEYGLAQMHLLGLALDIGAHIGTVSLALAVDNPELLVIALEPIPENADLLRRNVEANGVTDRVAIIEGMAGAWGWGQVSYGFRNSETALHHAFIGNSALGQQGEHRTADVPSYDLNRLLSGVPWYFRFAKIDCEGGEYDFLAASRDDLARVQEFRGEWHPLYGTRTRDDLRALLTETHEVTFTGPIEGPGGFRALRR